jgi:hypothetical protein
MTQNDDYFETTPEEDEEDLRAYEEAMEELRKNPVTYTHEEVKKMLGITDEEIKQYKEIQ